MLKKGICKLCLQEKLLIKSHIIANSFYKELLNDKKQLRIVSNIELLKENAKYKYLPSGIYDTNILCENCDNGIINSYEDYSRKILYAQKTLSKKTQPLCNQNTDNGLNYYLCNNVDYNKLKLFILSTLWKASVSKQHFFNEINLHAYDEELRVMILNNNAGEYTKFPVIISSWHHDKSFPTEFIGAPVMANISGEYHYLFIINGIIYQIFTSINTIPQSLKKFTLRPNECYIISMQEGMTSDLIKHVYKQS